MRDGGCCWVVPPPSNTPRKNFRIDTYVIACVEASDLDRRKMFFNCHYYNKIDWEIVNSEPAPLFSPDVLSLGSLYIFNPGRIRLCQKKS